MNTQGYKVLDALEFGDRGPTGLPVEVHCHGFGAVDFSDLAEFDLAALNVLCESEGVIAIPTLYLHRDRLKDFERLVHQYAIRRAAGELPFIAGLALEGPLLASHGGTPKATVWMPTRLEWDRLAALGEHGLKYMVMSPDAFTASSGLASEVTAESPRFEDIVPLLVSHGVRPALGHFTRDDPVRSAAQVDEIVDLAWSVPWGGVGARVVTDHLFNDMPLNIKHAFRTTRARAQRAELIESYQLAEWSLSNLVDRVGPVPAAIIEHAHGGRIGACINFDGEHVDLEIAKRAIELMGPENTMVMTDRCDSARLGGQELHTEAENSLWYQKDGIVAAGSQPLSRQVRNLSGVGFEDRTIWQLVAGTAHRVFGLSEVTAPSSAPGAGHE